MTMDALDRQAIKRGDCELIPMETSDAAVRDEMNNRTFKKGLTNRQGECSRRTGKIMITAGFGESKLNLWPRDEAGNLIE